MNLDTMSDLMTTRCLTDRTLKKSFFSPARPWRAETRLSPGFVLGSSRKPQRRPGRLTTRRRAQTWCSLFEPCAQRGVLARRGWVGGCLNFLSILLDGSPVMACVWTDFKLCECQDRFSEHPVTLPESNSFVGSRRRACRRRPRSLGRKGAGP